MKLLFVSILLFKLVNSFQEGALSSVFVKDSSVKKSGLSEFLITFNVIVKKDVESSKYLSSETLKLILVFPPILEYVKESSKLTLVSKNEHKLPNHLFAPFGLIKKDQVDPDKIGTCSVTDAKKVVDSLDEEHKKNMGLKLKKDLTRETGSLVLKGVTHVDINNVTFQKKLGKGLYSWTGVFKYRSDFKSATGIQEYFDHFLLTLGHSEIIPVNTDAYCLTHSSTAASVMFKHVDDLKMKLLHCESVYVPQLSNEFDMFPIAKPEFTVKFLYNVSNDMTINFSLKLDDKIIRFFKKQLYLIFDLPKEFNEPEYFKKDCKSQLEISASDAKCSYNNEKSQIVVTLLKKDVTTDKAIPLSISINKFKQGHKLLSEHNEFTLTVAKDLNEDYKIIPYENIQRTLTVSAAKHPECVDPVKFLYKLFEGAQKREVVLTRVTKTPDLSGNFLYKYSLTKQGTNYLMRIYFQSKIQFLFKVQLVLYIANKDLYNSLEEPDRSDILFYNYLPSNIGVKIDTQKITIALDATNNTIGNNKYFEIPLAFKSEVDPSVLSDPDTFRLILENKSSKAVLYGIAEKTSDNYSEDNKTHYMNGMSLRVENFLFDRTKPSVIFHLKNIPLGNFDIFLKFDKPKNILKYKHSMKNSFESSDSVKLSDKDYYRVEIKPSLLSKDKLDSSFELTVVPKDDEPISLDGVTVSIVSDPGVMVYTTLTGTVKFTKHIKFTPEDFSPATSKVLPCLAKDTRVTSSRFRESRNSNYILTRVVDCERPWLPFTNFTGAELDVSVDHTKDEFNHITTKEIISFNDKTKSKLVQALVANRVFYEHSLYLLFDKTAVDVLKKQMIAASVCKSEDETCPSDNHIPVLKKLVTSLFELEDLTFANVVVGYYDGSKLQVHLARDNEKKIDFSKPSEVTNIETTLEAFENLVDLASANASADKMGSSFSVLAVLHYEDVIDIQSELTKHKGPHDFKSVNGKYPNPVYAEIIPVDETSTVEYSIGCSGKNLMNLDDEDSIDEDEANKSFESHEPLYDIYSGHEFKSPVKEQKNIISPVQEEPSLGGADQKLKFKREDISLFILIKDVLQPSCIPYQSIEKTTLYVELKKSMNYMKVIPKAYHVFATCSSFKSDEFSKKQTKYVLSFRGVKIGEYLVTPNRDVSEKLYSECDLFSLYKHMPTSPYFTATTKHVPTILSTIKSNKVDKFTQVIESESV